MTEYISREAALKKQTIIIERYHAQGADEEYDHKVVRSEDIRAIPAADVKPVVKGEWSRVIAPMFEKYWCSECKGVTGKRSNFCPNCGADMRKEANDE